LSKTRKDSAKGRSYRVELSVVKNPDGTFEVVFNGEQVGTGVPEKWLDTELCTKYGFCGEEYEDILRQLNESGRAALRY
jgi:hypothetical protein